MNKQELLKELSAGEEFKYQGFLSGVFSNWYPVAFTIDGYEYRSTEQFYMAKKAEFFGDEVTLGRILETHSPRRAKELGKQVRLFDEQAWVTVSEKFMLEGNRAKYNQNPSAARVLMETNQDVLVECNSSDLIWGAGIDKMDSRLNSPFEWPGINKLGFLLMGIRNQL